MGRGRLAMEYIATEKARKSSFKKRRDGLVKKIRELSILCGIDACLIIYGPRGNEEGAAAAMEVHTWPAEREEVERVLKKYELKRNESSSKHLNLVDFFGSQTCKINERIGKMRREIARARFGKRMEFVPEGLSVEELNGVLVEVDRKSERVASCIEAEKEKQNMSRGIGVEMVNDHPQTHDYNTQTYEHFKPLVPDYNGYFPVMGDYIPGDYPVGVGNFGQFQAQEPPQYFQTSFHTADGLKNYGMGYQVGSYIAAQQQQQRLQQIGNCFQSGGDRLCAWPPENYYG